MEERKVFVSRCESHHDTMRMTTSAVFVVTSDPSRACTKKAINRDLHPSLNLFFIALISWNSMQGSEIEYSVQLHGRLMNDWAAHSNSGTRIRPNRAEMVEPSGAALMANSSGITVEVFSTNVALLRENIDQMFVLLTGAIICFLQVQVLLSLWWIQIPLNIPSFSKAGFGMLEAGSVRSKNTTNILTKNFGDLCLGVVSFCLVGYGLAFSEGNAWVGDS